MKKSQYILACMLVFLVVITLTIGCMEEEETLSNGDGEEASVLLTLVFDDYEANYSLEDLEAFDAYTGGGAYIKTNMLPDSVVLDDVHEYTGVPVTTLLEEIPDLPENYNVSIASDDGWTMEYTMNETMGEVDVYNETGDILPDETAVMILAYKEDGSYYSEIDPENEIGPLRIAFVGDYFTPSGLWSKLVVSIEIISLE